MVPLRHVLVAGLLSGWAGLLPGAVEEAAPAAPPPPPAAVDDPWTVDLRLRFGLVAPALNDEIDGTDLDLDSEASGGGGLLLLVGRRIGESRWRWLFGGGLSSVGHAGEADDAADTDVVYAASALELTGGIACDCGRWSFEGRPYLRVGRGAIRTSAEQSDDVYLVGVGDDGGYAALGMLVGATYTWDSGWQLGGELGGEGWVGESEIANVDHEVDGGGLLLMLGVGYRFR